VNDLSLIAGLSSYPHKDLIRTYTNKGFIPVFATRYTYGVVYMFAHPAGIVWFCDINDFYIFYNTSQGGHFINGSRTFREQLDQDIANGRFVNPWIECPIPLRFMKTLHDLPQWVSRMIGVDAQ
jgi:hypothetical protein